jgi:2-oxoglutarate ferredoxin oxidoreductase subunit alpha
MIYGAAATGARCLTSSSGLGLSLKSEAISYMAGAEIPAVIVDVMRGGPGLGTIGPAQQDYRFITKGPGSGGFLCRVFAPSTVQEAIDLTYAAFDTAEKDRNPVIVLADGCLGAMMEAVTLPKERSPSDNSDWSLAKSDRPYRIIKSFDLLSPVQEEFCRKLAKKYEAWDRETVFEPYRMEDAEYVIAAYGISGRICKTAVQMLRERGVKTGLIRPVTLTPFPKEAFSSLDPKKVKKILTVEMSIPGQFILDVSAAVASRIPVDFYGRSGGIIVEEDEIVEKMLSMAGKA